MKVVFHYDAGPGLCAELGRTAASLHVAVVPDGNRKMLTRELADADVLLHVLSPVTSAMIADAGRLRLIQKIGVGVDAIDLETARDRGIAVCNMPGTNTQAVAEMTLLLMLATLRRVVDLDGLARSGSWAVPAGLADGFGELAGRTVGLIGYGAVPQRLAPILSAIGARTVAYARAAPNDGTPILPLDRLLAESDCVSLHLPATADTIHLLDDRRLHLMRRGAIFINTARGSLVDQVALAAALKANRIAAAGLDVFATEPIRSADPLTDLPNVVLTPHAAWLTRETLRRSVALALENCRRLEADEPLLNRVV